MCAQGYHTTRKYACMMYASDMYVQVGRFLFRPTAARKLLAEAENVEILFEVTLNELGKCTYICACLCRSVCILYIYCILYAREVFWDVCCLSLCELCAFLSHLFA